MNYVKWKGRIDICGMFLLLFLLIAVLLLPVGIDDFQKKNYIPVEIKYPLSEIPEDQAVFVRWISFSSLDYAVIVNREGQWKLFDFKEVPEEYYVGKTLDYMFFDSVLQDNSIPWRNEKIIINPDLLERALNLPEVEFTKEKPRPITTVMTVDEWYLVDNSPERQEIFYRMSTPLKLDYTVTYMQNKMKQIDSLGLQIYAERHQIPIK